MYVWQCSTVVQDGGVSHGPSLSDSRAQASIFRGQGGPGGGLTSRSTPTPPSTPPRLGNERDFQRNVDGKTCCRERFFFLSAMDNSVFNFVIGVFVGLFILFVRQFRRIKDYLLMLIEQKLNNMSHFPSALSVLISRIKDLEITMISLSGIKITTFR